MVLSTPDQGGSAESEKASIGIRHREQELALLETDSAARLQKALEERVNSAESLVDAGGVFTAGFGEVGPSAAGASNELREFLNDFSGVKFRREIFRDGGDESDLAVIC